MSDMTPSKAKKLVKQALADAGVPFTKLRARTVGFEGLGYGSAVFVKPIGAHVPDSRINEAKAALKGSGAILDLPQIVPPQGMTIE